MPENSPNLNIPLPLGNENVTRAAHRAELEAIDQNAAKASDVVAHLAENAIDAHAAIPACRVYHSVNQSIASGVLTALAFNSERFDTDTIHDPVTNNSRLTCKTAGIYYVFGNISWATNLTTGTRGLYIRANGTGYIAVVQGNPTTEAGKNTIQNINCIVQLAVNEYLELMAFQSQGASVDVVASGNYSPEFGMVKVG